MNNNDILKSGSINSLIRKTCNKLDKQHFISPRGLLTKELLNQRLILTNPKNNIITLPERNYSLKYLCGEILWYLWGSLKLKDIEQYSSFWKTIANKNGTINSNYGYIIFHQKLDKYNYSQFDWIIDQLIKDEHSRQALINFNQPIHKYTNNKDFVCTTTLQFLIRNNRLHLITNMRSNDIIYGVCYDLPFFTFIQQMAWLILVEKYPYLQLGYYIHNTASLHVYKKFFKMCKNISNAKPRTSKQLPYPDMTFMKDLICGTQLSCLMKFLYRHSKFPHGVQIDFKHLDLSPSTKYMKQIFENSK